MYLKKESFFCLDHIIFAQEKCNCYSKTWLIFNCSSKVVMSTDIVLIYFSSFTFLNSDFDSIFFLAIDATIFIFILAGVYGKKLQIGSRENEKPNTFL